MKKINVLFLSVALFSFFSCNSGESEQVEDPATDEIVETEEVKKSDVVNGFSSDNKELNAFVEEFDAFFDKSLALMQAGDMEGLNALEEEGKALQEKGDAIKDNMTEEEEEMLEEYMKSRVTEMVKASGLENLGKKVEEEMNNQ